MYFTWRRTLQVDVVDDGTGPAAVMRFGWNMRADVVYLDASSVLVCRLKFVLQQCSCMLSSVDSPGLQVVRCIV